MNRFLNLLSIVFAALALLSTIWIIFPAPIYNIWLFSVAASEWSLWLALLALLSIISSIINGIFYSDSRFWAAPLMIGTAALAIALYPLFSVLKLAGQNSVSLSLSNYFAGVKNNNSNESNNFVTYSFNQIEGQDLRLDVYKPSVDSENTGASVIVVHGGLWNRGVRNDFPQWNEWLAARGFTVFDIDYRLAPQPNYAAAIGDVKCAVGWVKKHSAEFNVSPNRIAILGRSAGGQLALAAAYSAADLRLPPSCADVPTDSDVRAVISIYGPTDLLWDYDNPANQRVIDGPAALSAFIGGSPHESEEFQQRFAMVSPVQQVSPNSPPTLLIQGGQDQLVRPENLKLLADKLSLVNVKHQTIYIPYAQHGFDYNFNGWGSQITKSVLLDFLQQNTAKR